jgi:hypothetical protein
MTNRTMNDARGTRDGIEDLVEMFSDVIEGKLSLAVGDISTTPQVRPRGIATGAAYSDLDSMGAGAFGIMVPPKGVIQTARYFDLDDEGLAVDLILFRSEPAAQTDNSALSISDVDLVKVIDTISFSSFTDGAAGKVSTKNGLNIMYDLPGDSQLWAQLQARGALNIAAGKLPTFELVIVTL